MKKVYLWVAGIVAVIIAALSFWGYVKDLQRTATVADQNRIASVKMYNDEKNKTYALNVKCEDLSRINNSQIRTMDSIREAMKIKDKQLKALWGSKSSADIKDTLFVPIYHNSIDTVYKSISNNDTCIGDVKWYNVCVERLDSNYVVLSAHFQSDLTLITSEKKETINKPRKTWFGRLFQKKVKTMSVTAVELNPYVNRDSTLFVIPIK